MLKKLLLKHGLHLLAILSLTGIFLFALHQRVWLADTFRDFDHFRAAILARGGWGWLVFIGIQALQVVIAPIPGEVTQVAAGYTFGTIPGMLLSMSGMVLGSGIAFAFSRTAGKPLVRKMSQRPAYQKLTERLHSRRSEVLLVILYLVPGFPKDFLAYLMGLAPISTARFFFALIIGRLPMIWVSAYSGAHLQDGHYFVVGLVVSVCVVLCVAGFLLKDRLINLFHRHTHHTSDSSGG